MAEIIEINVRERKRCTKSEFKKLRREGEIPGVVYGPEVENAFVWVSFKELKEKLKGKKGKVVILKFLSKDSDVLNNKMVILKDQQIDPITFNILHLDFYEFKKDEEMDIEVALQLKGEPVGVKKGGILEWSKRTMWVRCLPAHIPEVIEVDISNLDIGKSLHIGDIPLPPGIKAVEDKEIPVVTVIAPAAEEVEEKKEEEIAEPEVIKKGKEEKEEEKEEKEEEKKKEEKEE